MSAELLWSTKRAGRPMTRGEEQIVDLVKLMSIREQRHLFDMLQLQTEGRKVQRGSTATLHLVGGAGMKDNADKAIIGAMRLLIEAGPAEPLDHGALGDALLLEAEEEWENLPRSTKAVLVGVGAKLKRQYADDVFADMQAEKIVSMLKGS